MAYRVDLRAIEHLLSTDPADYRPILDFAEGDDLPEEEEITRTGRPRAQQVSFRCKNWTKAKERVREHIEALRYVALWKAGASIPHERPFFSCDLFESGDSSGPWFPDLAVAQAEEHSLDEILLMRRHLDEAGFEQVDSRHEDIPF